MVASLDWSHLIIAVFVGIIAFGYGYSVRDKEGRK